MTNKIDNNKKLILQKDIFVKTEGDSYLVYSPLNKKVSIVSEETLSLVKKFSSNEILDKEHLDHLVETGFLVIEEQKKIEINEEFKPTSVTLFSSSQCNLRCVYCYANAGEENDNLKIEVAKAGIDLAINNALSKGVKQPGLNFHGGGEPTFNWKVFTEAISYFKEQTKKEKLKGRITCATNGVFSEDRLSWIINNLSHIQISIDGPKDIQDYQRPLENGKGSFKFVDQTLKTLKNSNLAYSIRSTVTEYGVNRMKETLRFFVENYSPDSIHFEPLFECGRCKVSGWQAPSVDDFVSNYFEAIKEAELLKAKLFTSTGRIDYVTTRFCGAAGTNFGITPDGKISSCYEVTSENHDFSEIFLYGEYDSKTNSFTIDEEKRKYLKERTTDNLIKVAHTTGDIYKTNKDGFRCKQNQDIAYGNIKKIVNNGEKCNG